MNESGFSIGPFSMRFLMRENRKVVFSKYVENFKY